MIDHATIAHFATDYADARAKFRTAARAAGASLSSYANPGKGPAGEALSTDVARVGPATAGRVLFLLSATHGAEGFCGSGCQVSWLASAEPHLLPPDLAVVVIHAINPHGFAWLRRVTEENVDLNRNFIAHNADRPVNEGYGELHGAILPKEWTPASIAASEAVLYAYREKHGLAEYQSAVSAGQYDHADGLFFGGLAPTWANQTLRAIVAAEAGAARHVASIDFHTGLGPYGYGEPIAHYPAGSAELQRSIAWWGDSVASALVGNSTSLHGKRMKGSINDGIRESAPNAVHTNMALEFGTCPLDVVFRALQADNWLHVHGDPASTLGREIKAMVRNAFFRDEDDWKLLVALRGRLMIRRAIAGLAGC